MSQSRNQRVLQITINQLERNKGFSPQQRFNILHNFVLNVMSDISQHTDNQELKNLVKVKRDYLNDEITEEEIVQIRRASRKIHQAQYPLDLYGMIEEEVSMLLVAGLNEGDGSYAASIVAEYGPRINAMVRGFRQDRDEKKFNKVVDEVSSDYVDLLLHLVNEEIKKEKEIIGHWTDELEDAMYESIKKEIIKELKR